MKDPKDIIKEMNADLMGVSPDKVEFSNFRDRKKNKKKVKKVVESESNGTIISNDEGFSITDVSVEICSYAEIGRKRRRLRQKNNLEEWGAFDFFIYAQEKYLKKYGTSWELNIGGGSLEIKKIKDKFLDMFGFCCNLVMRDYIDFFFDNYMDMMIRVNGDFYFSQMNKEKILIEFYDGYNFAQSFARYSEIEKSNDKDTISRDEIRASYQIGDTSLVSNYGIVLSVNWLVKIKKENPTEAVRTVIAACREIAKKNMIEVVKSSTEAYSPYPSFIPFKTPQLIMDRINPSIKLNVEFNNNNKYEFLK